MILTFRPLKVRPAHWLDADADRPTSPFDSTFTSTLELLDRELAALDATDVFLQVDAGPNGVRLDGQLRANAIVNHPGVILTVETRNRGTLVWSTDRFGRRAWSRTAGPAWQQNLRAIALGMEALRRVERYGIAEQGQQYAGYQELGTGTPMGAGETVPLTREQAWLILSDAAEVEADDITTDLATVYRLAVKRHHPDHGGDPDLFRLITEARDLLATTP